MFIKIILLLAILSLLIFMGWYDLKHKLLLHRSLLLLWLLLHSLAYLNQYTLPSLEISLNLLFIVLPALIGSLVTQKMGMGDVKLFCLLAFYLPFISFSFSLLLAFISFILFALFTKQKHKLPFLPFFLPFLSFFLINLFNILL